MAITIFLFEGDARAQAQICRGDEKKMISVCSASLRAGAEVCLACTMTYCDVRCNEDCSSLTSRSGIFVMSHGGNHFVPAC